MATFISVAACGLATWLLGRDLNWDYFNYHAYAAQLTQQNRLGQDFMAAGLQGYLNPLAYAPLGYLSRWGASSLTISLVLASVQALNLTFLYLVSRHLLGELKHARMAACFATVLGGLTGVLWSQVGSTFVDALISPLVLAAWWLLIRFPQRVGMLSAAVLAGAAVALKWTFAPYAAGLLAATLAIPGASRKRISRGLASSVAAGIGFVVFYGSWGLALNREFGSPVFPLFNSIFQSPDYPAYSNSFLRFVPDSWQALFLMPWRMTLNEAWVYTEISAPDLRPAMLLLLVAGLLCRHLVTRGGSTLPQPPRHASSVLASVVFLLVSLAGWVLTSSNGRYGVPLFLALGPMVWLAAYRLLGENLARVGGALLICLQAIHLSSAGAPRWNAQQWTEQFLPAEVPARLISKPHLMITVGTSSESYLATLVHPDSPFTNPLGMYALANDGPGWSRFAQLRERWDGATEVVFRSPADFSGPHADRVYEVVDQMIDRLGLTLERSGCDQLVFNRPPEGAAVDAKLQPIKRFLASCPAKRKSRGDLLLAHQRELAGKIMDALEDRCRKYFQPARPQIEGTSEQWVRRYLQHDLFVHVDFGNDAITFKQERQATHAPIGQVSTWERDVASFECRLPHGGARGVMTLSGERR